MRVLIVEDQEGTREVLEFAVRKALPRFAPDFTPEDYDVAGWYRQAEELIEARQYDVVLLDHRMPFTDQGDLERRDLSSYSQQLHEIGYDLIPRIRERNPSAVIIGTSSLSAREMSGVPAPDCTLHKTWSDAQRELEEILTTYKEILTTYKEILTTYKMQEVKS